MEIKFKKPDLIAALEAKLPEVEAFDARQLKAHYVKNKEVAKARRAVLREYIAMPDDKLAEHTDTIGGRYNDDKWPRANTCPLGQARNLRAAISFLRNDSRQTITVKGGDQYGGWLTRDWSSLDEKDGRLC